MNRSRDDPYYSQDPAKDVEDEAETEPVTEVSKLRTKPKRTVGFQKELLPLKLAIFLVYGADSFCVPYLTVQMVQAGFDLEEVAIVYAVLPFVTFVVPPLAGVLADKFRQYKLFLIGLVALAATCHTMLLFVDAKIGSDTPEILTEMNCSPNGTSLRFVMPPNTNNTSCSNLTSNNDENDYQSWSATFIPTDCQLINCPTLLEQEERIIEMCNLQDNNSTSYCAKIQLNSKTKFHFNNFEISPDYMNAEEEPSQNCTAQIVAKCQPCSIQCPMKMKLTSSDKKDVERKENDRRRHQKGFWIYFMFRIAASSTLAAAFSMLDATATCMVKKYDGDLGKQRIFGVIGQAAFGIASGFVLDWTIEFTGFQDYSYMFFMADGLFFLGIILIFLLDVDVERLETENLGSSLKKITRMIDVDIFMVMMLVLGTCWGFLESFYFVFLMELNANNVLLGISVFAGCAMGVPCVYIADWVVRRIGSVNLVIMCFFLYGVRFFGLSLIHNPWLCLLFEPCEAVCVHMMAVASIMYCAAAAPPGLLGTLNGAVGSVHYSFGRGVGSFVGGILISNFGTRPTYQMFGSYAVIFGLIYLFAHKFYLVNMEKIRLRRKSERVASIISCGGVPEEDEPNERYIIPPDMMKGRRMSCF